MKNTMQRRARRAGAVTLAAAMAFTMLPANVLAAGEEAGEAVYLDAQREAKSAADIIKNGGFEDGLEDWSGKNATISIAEDDQASGSQCVKVTNRPATGDGPQQDITGKVRAGDVLTVSAKVKYTTGPEKRKFYLTADYNGTFKNIAGADIKKGEWGTISGTYTVPDDVDLSSVKVFLETSWTQEQDAENDRMDFYADDVVIENARLTEENPLAYFVDCGDYVVSTVCEGDEFGTHNSVTDQVFGEDSATGYEWGIVDTVSDPLLNGSQENKGVFTDHTWPYEFHTAGKDTASKTDTNRYTRNQYEDGIEIRYLDYKFELEAGTYSVETYTADPWSCSQSPTLILDGEGKTKEQITEAFQEGEGTVLSSGTAVKERVTVDENGFLNVGFRAKGNENKAINVCYIKITDASKEKPEEYVKQDLADLNFPSSYISGDLDFPTVGANGSSISWSSSNPDVIAEDGTVNRPGVGEEDVQVEVTATVSYDTETAQKTFSFTVYAQNPAENLGQFALDEVLITDPYYKAAQDSDIAFLKKFDNDRILSRFRETAGLDTKGASPYKGWESSLIGGHSVGHYLTAVAQAIKATGDEELRQKLAAIIDELSVCQDALGTGFIFGAQIDDPDNVERQFDIVEGKLSGNTWVPWYTMHKIVTGLVDTYKLTQDEDALKVAEGLGEWIYNRVSKWDKATQDRISWTEYGGMNDCLYELYKLTGNTHFRDAAHKFDDPALYEKILSGADNTLNQRHANTTIPKFLGALNRYVALKERGDEMTAEDEKYLGYAEDFWTLVVEKHVFITGGTSDMEHFKADNSLDAIRTQCNCESCCAHNMLKLSKELFKITGEKKYADYYENTLRNAIMGAVNPENGTTTYFTPMATGYYKVFGNADPAQNMFWCCTGSGMENYTKLGDSIYFWGDDALFVNQYVASEVTWEEKQVRLVQNSDVTASEEAEFTVHLLEGAQSVDMKLYLRIPDWIGGEAQVKVNGEILDAVVSAGYVCAERTWQEGDQITLTYPMKVRAYGLPDDDTVFGFKYGPTVLAAKLGTEEWDATTWAGANLTAPAYKVVGSEKVRLNVSYGQTTRQILGTETLAISDGMSIQEFMENADQYFERLEDEGVLSFRIKGTDADDTFAEGLTFVPFNTLNEERYGIYWYFQGGEEKPSEDTILEDKEEGRFAASLVDSIQPGYPQYETDDIHQMEESNTQFGNMPGIGSSRYAEAGGYFSYNMVVNKEKENLLLCQFAKEDNGKTIRITVGDTAIADETLSYDGQEASYRKYYSIPSEEIQKASQLEANGELHDVVKVRFESGNSQDSARLVSGLFMTVPYSKDARILEITSPDGTVSSQDQVFTLTVPKDTEEVKVTVAIADKMGLLYLNGTLVNDTKAQTVVLSEGETLVDLKVYGEDHVTFRDYVLKIVREEEGVQDPDQEELEEAIKKAEAAEEAAQKAREEAQAAKEQAEAAYQEAQAAKAQAQAAQEAADAAWEKAKEAQAEAEAAKNQAGADSQAAQEAQAKAEALANEAKAAQAKAQASQADAQASQEKADAAMKLADQKMEQARQMAEQAEAAMKAAEAARAQAEAAKLQAEAERLQAEADAKKAQEERKKAEAAEKAAQEAKRQAEEALKAALQAKAEAEKQQQEQESEKPQATVKGEKVNLKSVKKGKKGQLKVNWTKVSGASGYEIQFAVNGKFKKAQTKKVGKAKNSVVLKKLKSGKKYRVRVRAYQIVDGKKVYSSYSKGKTIKVR